MPRIMWASAVALAVSGCVRGSPAEAVVDEVAWSASEGAADRRQLAHGQALFARRWRVGDAQAGGDGLGPLFNERSCVACHHQGGRGGSGPSDKNAELLVRRGEVRLLHKAGTSPEYLDFRKAALAGKPLIDDPADAPRRQLSVAVIERNTPALFGDGKLDAVSPGELLLLADQQRRHPHVSGRVGRTADGRIGRFGWKGDVHSLGEFVAQACANELGLATDEHPQAALAIDAGPQEVDLDAEQVAAIEAFVAALPPPVEVEHDVLPMHPGEALFNQVGCGDCHVENVGDVPRVFSDLLLHDLGSLLSDGRVRAGAYGGARRIDPRVASEMASPREWRTPPLWGVADSGPWMHDGRARTLEFAIQLHDGEGRAAKSRFFTLPADEQAQVLGFLGTLRAPWHAADP